VDFKYPNSFIALNLDAQVICGLADVLNVKLLTKLLLELLNNELITSDHHNIVHIDGNDQIRPYKDFLRFLALP
jgi:hypothetical protein